MKVTFTSNRLFRNSNEHSKKSLAFYNNFRLIYDGWKVCSTATDCVTKKDSADGGLKRMFIQTNCISSGKTW